MSASQKVYTYVSFYSQKISSLMGSKALKTHCYYRISQEQSSSTVTFQPLI